MWRKAGAAPERGACLVARADASRLASCRRPPLPPYPLPPRVTPLTCGLAGALRTSLSGRTVPSGSTKNGTLARGLYATNVSVVRFSLAFLISTSLSSPFL